MYTRYTGNGTLLYGLEGHDTCAARNQHTDTVRRLRIVLWGGAPANCALYTIVALSRLTPIDLLSLYKVTQNNVINYQSSKHC